MRDYCPSRSTIFGAASLVAIIMSSGAHAQSTSQAPADATPVASSPTSQAAPATADPSTGEPSTGDPSAAVAAEAPLLDPIDSNLVDVSLGDWALKNELASQLKVKVSQIPLTVAVPSKIASEVCPIGNDELDQQKVTSATRTCAAKQMSDELRDEVRGQLRDTSAD